MQTWLIRVCALLLVASSWVIMACDPSPECQGSNVSFVKCIRPALRANCSGGGCHGAVDTAVGLDLETIGKIYDGVIVYVKAGDPAGSYLMQKMGPNPPAGARMPPDLRPVLSDSQMKMFETWINEGAKNDDPNYKK